MKNLFTYTLPRPFFGYNIPIAIQSSFLRDYAKKNKLNFSLPTTEITKENCYDILINLLSSKIKIENLGVVSGFVFPLNNKSKLENIFFKKNLNKNIKIHMALENIILDPEEIIEWSSSIIFHHKITKTYNNLGNNYDKFI